MPPPRIEELLLSGDAPPHLAPKLLRRLMETGDDEALVKILSAAAAPKGEDKYKEKTAELEALIEELREGPLRMGTFLHHLDDPGVGRRAVVRLTDGSSAISQVIDEALVLSLQRGDTVGLDARCRAVVARLEQGVEVGEEARIESVLDPTRVVVSLRDSERYVFHTAAELARRIVDEEVRSGSRVLVDPRLMMAFSALAEPEGASRRRYLVESAVPDVVVERDVGAPPACIDQLTEHLRRELTDPDRARHYGLRRCVTQLMTGIPGSGKTFCVQALWRRMYEVMAEVTGVALEELPPRVMRFRASTILSKWLGEADQNIDRFFDELESLAAETYVDAAGVEHVLPVLAIFEEIDGIARSRGDDAVYDRIQTTLLQRLDVTSRNLGERLVLFLFTTNCPELVDPAFQRRAADRVERFGRLDRVGFSAVLDRHLARRPVRPANGEDPEAARARTIAQLAGWLFGRNDPPQLELAFTSGGEAQQRHRRDFLNAGLIDRAVQQAATAACREERAGQPAGIAPRHLAGALAEQVASVVGQLRPENARLHLDLPDGVRVGTVRRLPQPTVLPAELEQA